jgi:hypothetical protein
MKKKKKSIYRIEHDKKVKEKLELIEGAIRKDIISELDIKRLLASSWVEMEVLEKKHQDLLEMLEDSKMAIGAFNLMPLNSKNNRFHELLKMLEEGGNETAKKLLEANKEKKSYFGLKMANALHDKENGSREKRSKIREIWATGKYSSKDLCAEQECAALEMSLSTARKALRNMPKPK